MNKYKLNFYRKANDDWILICFFADLQFKNLQECEDFALTFLKNKRKRKNIKDSVKYIIEEL